MISRSDHAIGSGEAAIVGVLRGASIALLATGVIGGVALALALVWPWLAWGYVVVALVLAVALHVVVWRVEWSLEREVEAVRRQHRSR